MEHEELMELAGRDGFDSIEAFVSTHAAKLSPTRKAVFEKLRRLAGADDNQGAAIKNLAHEAVHHFLAHEREALAELCQLLSDVGGLGGVLAFLADGVGEPDAGAAERAGPFLGPDAVVGRQEPPFLEREAERVVLAAEVLGLELLGARPAGRPLDLQVALPSETPDRDAVALEAVARDRLRDVEALARLADHLVDVLWPELASAGRPVFTKRKDSGSRALQREREVGLHARVAREVADEPLELLPRELVVAHALAALVDPARAVPDGIGEDRLVGAAPPVPLGEESLKMCLMSAMKVSLLFGERRRSWARAMIASTSARSQSRRLFVVASQMSRSDCMMRCRRA
jgi:hypothetical protein